MISIGKPIHNAQAAADYCEHQEKAEETYYEEKSAPSQWLGAGAQALGLQGPVDRQRFESLLEKGVEGMKVSEGRRMGVDLTWSIPKSVSMLTASAPPEMRARLLALCTESNRVAMRHIESHVVQARFGKNGKQTQATGSAIIASYQHVDARPVKQPDGSFLVDPDIHFHNVVVNATQDPETKEWRSLDLDFGALSVEQHLADFKAKAHLAAGMREMGFEIEKTADGFEVSGISRDQIETFSQRKAQVDEALKAQGLTRTTSTGAERGAANQKTRLRKRDQTQDELNQEWQSRLETAGIDAQALQCNQTADQNMDAHIQTFHAYRASEHTLNHLSERESLFSQRQAELETLKAGMGDAGHEQLTHALAANRRVLQAGAQSKEVEIGTGDKARKTIIRARMITTREIASREGWLMGFCEQSRSTMPPLMSLKAAQSVIASTETAQKFEFGDDQRKALQDIFTSQDKIVAVIGAAGAGKTTAMQSAVSAGKSLGYETIGLTPSHGARQELLDARTDTNVTLQSFLMKDTPPDAAPRLFVVDEAGMMGDRTFQSFFKNLRPQDRVLLVGDPDQLKSVEAGDTLKMLRDKQCIAVSSITQVQRQKYAEDKRLLALGQAWADKNATKALTIAKDYMQQVEAVGTGPIDKKTGLPKVTRDDRRKDISERTAANYLSRSPEDRDITLITAATNDVREQINSLIRKGLQDRGELGADIVTVTQLRKTKLTIAQRRQAHQYQVGQVLRMEEGKGKNHKIVDYEITTIGGQKNRLTIKDRDGETIKEIDPARLDHKRTQLFSVQEGMGIAVGDSVVIRDNSYGKEFGIQNGDGGHVTNIKDGQITIETAKGKALQIDKAKAQAVDYGWCRTVNDSQGKSVDLSLAAFEASTGASSNLTLVGTTRMKHGLVIVTDNINGLIKRSQVAADKNLAVEAKAKADNKQDASLSRLEAAIQKGREKGQAALSEIQIHQQTEAPTSPTPIKESQEAPLALCSISNAQPDGQPPWQAHGDMLRDNGWQKRKTGEVTESRHGQARIHDYGNRLDLQSGNGQEVAALLALAEEKGWTEIQIDAGDSQFREAIIREAQSIGIEVVARSQADRQALKAVAQQDQGQEM